MVSADGLSKFSVKKRRFLSVFCNSLWRNGDFCRFFAILRGEIEIFISLGSGKDLYFLLYEINPSLEKRDVQKVGGLLFYPSLRSGRRDCFLLCLFLAILRTQEERSF